jgi:hypothetical protein
VKSGDTLIFVKRCCLIESEKYKKASLSAFSTDARPLWAIPDKGEIRTAVLKSVLAESRAWVLSASVLKSEEARYHADPA